MSMVDRDGTQVRPDWEYQEKRRDTVSMLDLLEMLESIRNVLEAVRDRLPEKKHERHQP